MQNFYRCDEGYEERAWVTSHNRCIKLVKDMHYEAQVQCVINYDAMFLKQKIKCVTYISLFICYSLDHV